MEAGLRERSRIDPEATADVRDRELALTQALGQAGAPVAGDVAACGLLERLLLEDHLRSPGPKAVGGPPPQPDLGSEGRQDGGIRLRVALTQLRECSGVGRIRQGGYGRLKGLGLGRDEVAGPRRGHGGRLAPGRPAGPPAAGRDLALGLTEC